MQPQQNNGRLKVEFYVSAQARLDLMAVGKRGNMKCRMTSDGCRPRGTGGVIRHKAFHTFTVRHLKSQFALFVD